MRKIITLILFAASIFTIKGQTPPAIVFSMADGSTQRVQVAATERLNFLSEGLQIQSKDGSQSVLSIDQIKKITFSNLASISEMSGNGDIVVFYDGQVDELIIRNAAQGSAVAVYSVAGALVLNSRIKEQRGIDMSSISRGMYIVRVNNKAIKFRKR